MKQTMEEYCDAAEQARQTETNVVSVPPTRLKISDIAWGVFWGNVMTALVVGAICFAVALINEAGRLH